MSNANSRFTLVLMLATLALSGCTTFTYHEQKAAGYDKAVSSLRVIWKKTESLPLRITKTAMNVTPLIDPRDRERTSEKVFKVLGILRSGTPQYLVENLRAQGVTVLGKNDPEPEEARLIFKPIGGIGDCSLLDCAGSLNLKVELADVELEKVVWTASFKIGSANTLKDPDESVAQSFYTTLIDKLKRAGLIASQKK